MVGAAGTKPGSALRYLVDFRFGTSAVPKLHTRPSSTKSVPNEKRTEGLNACCPANRCCTNGFWSKNPKPARMRPHADIRSFFTKIRRTTPITKQMQSKSRRPMDDASSGRSQPTRTVITTANRTTPLTTNPCVHFSPVVGSTPAPNRLSRRESAQRGSGRSGSSVARSCGSNVQSPASNVNAGGALT